MRAILTFHSIDSQDSTVSFGADLFAALLTHLHRKGIPVLDLDALLSRPAGPGVAITFDDGMSSVYRNALPILSEHQAPAHMFLTTGLVEAGAAWPPQPAAIPSYEILNWSQVEALHRAGVRMESHTHTHPDLRGLTLEQAVDECERARRLIETRLGRKPAYFAYPFGLHNTRVRNWVRSAYSGAVTTELRPLGANEDPAALPRLDAYYFRSGLKVRHLDSVFMRCYLGARNRLRNLKGSQCAGDAA